MRRTFSTYLPEEAGARERAAEVVSSEGADIVRLSYNRAVDAHTVFIEAEGSEEQIERIKQRFNAMGYFDGERNFVGVVLFEFNLPDGTNDILPLLRLIKRFGFNISYVSAGSAEGNRQTVKMGLLVENNEDVSPFINRAAELCSVKVLDYDKSSKTLDNTVFYLSFAGDIARKMRLDERSQRLLTVNANFIMQILEDKGIAPHPCLRMQSAEMCNRGHKYLQERPLIFLLYG